MISREDVVKLAELSRVAVSETELAVLQKDLESILGYVSEIQSVSEDAPERTAGELRNVMRDDANPHESGTYTKDMLAAAPRTDGDYLSVKQVL